MTDTSKSTLSDRDTDSLMARKEQLVAKVAADLTALGLTPDYSWNIMMAAKRAGDIPRDAYVRLIERLLEIEAIKYTLAARLIREMDPDQ
ncbi:hypothetical protein WV31_12835 [Magnetospirillum sp. ME-1]|uniref:hypothetical protein n=1 Tax=Magnetospirillum sp. ME-1 TaxID=1639348 RepID=UPI000A17C8AD|nr:hypothetical protein [Magnetospirillum sp. ME-1]ARJ66491.1 hypothetical protein WV31_12835 [Magnetospirillum sp. ME-1]